MIRPGLLTPLFDALPIGVVVLDRKGKVVVFNEHEERLAGRRRERVLGRPFFKEIAPCMDIRELAGAFFDRVGSGTLDERVELEFAFPHAESPRAVACRLRSFVAEDEPFGLLLVEDVSMQRAVDQLKTMLADLLVHDLKNPLAVVLANVDLAKRRLAGLDPQATAVAERLDAAKTAGWRLNEMILTLLDVTRLRTGTLPLALGTVDVAVLLRETTSAMLSTAEQNGRRIALDVPDALVHVADAGLLRRVVDNLVDNALRHTPEGTTVTVRGCHDAGALVVDVEDEGPGVPPELRDQIFDPYVTVQARHATHANRGLGLTFVQLAVRAHGGDVVVLGRDGRPSGSHFRVRLPARHDA